jgi:hypothetical protein
MISVRSQVCATAERIVSAIHSWALNAGMRIETKGEVDVSRSTLTLPSKAVQMRWLPAQ